jgi:hypothetical protein
MKAVLGRITVVAAIDCVGPTRVRAALLHPIEVKVGTTKVVDTNGFRHGHLLVQRNDWILETLETMLV